MRRYRFGIGWGAAIMLLVALSFWWHYSAWQECRTMFSFSTCYKWTFMR